MKSCCVSTSHDKKCRRTSDNKIFSLPRRFTKKRCVSGKVRGFTMRSSCAPYKDCKATRKRRKYKGGAAPPPRDMPTNLHEFMQQITHRDIISAETKLISLFSKFARGFTENHLSDLGQEIRDEIRAFNGDTESLLFMLFLLTIRDEIEMEYRLVPPGLRGLFIVETNNIRNELLQALSRLHYHLHAISHFMNIEPDLITHEWIMDISPNETPTIVDSIGERNDTHEEENDISFSESTGTPETAPDEPHGFENLGAEYNILPAGIDYSFEDGGPLRIDDLEDFDDFNGGKKRRAKRKNKRTHKRRKHKKTGKSLKKKHYKKHK